MPRLFVAVWPPPEVLARLAALPRTEQDGVRWTREDQWHVTLRFLGEADPDEAEEALTAVVADPAVATLGPQVSRLGRAVVVAPVVGLDDLAAAVRSATAAVGEPVDPRPFTGHITLARLRAPGLGRLPGTAIEGAFAVDEIALVESRRHAEGARYVTRAVRRLR